MKIKLPYLFLTLCLLLAGTGITCAQKLNMGDSLPIDTSVRIGKLDNGMAYYLRHNAKAKGLADFYIVYDVGSIQEEDTQTGLAHFLEHMMFNGTKNFPGDSMIRWLEHIGLQLGTNFNAATGMEMTYYQLTQVPLKRESIADSILLILHDWSGFLSLQDKEINKERSVIIEELRQRNNEQFRMGNKAALSVYGNTRYAHRDMLGTEEFLRTFDSQTLRNFYKRWYRPDLQAIVIVGDFDVDHMETKLKQVMCDIPRPQQPAAKEAIAIPDNTTPIVKILTDPEQQTTKANFFIKRTAVPKEMNNRVGATCMNLMINIATAMVNTRFEELMQQMGCPFSSAVLRNNSLTTSCDALELQVVARGDAIAEAFTSAYGELERIRRNGFTQAEFDLVRTGVLRSGKYVYEIANDRDNGALAWECINHYVKNVPLLSAQHRWNLTQIMLTQQLTLEQLNELMSHLISPANNVLVITAPETAKASFPKEEQLAGFFSWIAEADIEPYQPEKIDKPLLAEEITPGHVEKSEEGIYGSTVWTLNNGIRVVVLPTADSPHQIKMSGEASGGLSTVADADYFTASLAAEVVSASGIGGFTPGQLQKVVGSKVASVQPSIRRFSTSITGGAAKGDVETLLQLTWLYFMRPDFDRERFDLLLKTRQLNLARISTSPIFIQSQEIDRAIYGEQLRTQIPNERILNTIDFEKIKPLYQKFFTDAAGNYTFYFIGDIDIAALQPLVEKYLGNIPAGTQRLAWQDDGVREITGIKQKVVETPMETSRSIVRLVYSGELAYTQLNLLTTQILASCLQSRYNQVIREEKGGSYGVTVNGSLSPQPISTYTFTIFFQTNPERADELVKITKDELARLAENGPEPSEVDNHLESWRKMEAQNAHNSLTWLFLLQNYYNWGEGWGADYEQLMKNVTPEKIRDLARKIIADGNLKQVVVRPPKE